jgi:hypothetical protein
MECFNAPSSSTRVLQELSRLSAKTAYAYHPYLFANMLTTHEKFRAEVWSLVSNEDWNTWLQEVGLSISFPQTKTETNGVTSKLIDLIEGSS